MALADILAPEKGSVKTRIEPAPTGVVSLLDMLVRVQAIPFATAVALLDSISAKASSGVKSMLVVSNGFEKQQLVADIRTILEQCELLGLEHTVNLLKRHGSHYFNNSVSWSEVAQDVKNIRYSLHKELERPLFLVLDNSRSDLFSHDKALPLFGPEVETAFPSAAGDIQEAGNCLALDRWPASVFHCMRVLEIGLAALAANFGLVGNWRDSIWRAVAGELYRCYLRILATLGRANPISQIKLPEDPTADSGFSLLSRSFPLACIDYIQRQSALCRWCGPMDIEMQLVAFQAGAEWSLHSRSIEACNEEKLSLSNEV